MRQKRKKKKTQRSKWKRSPLFAALIVLTLLGVLSLQKDFRREIFPKKRPAWNQITKDWSKKYPVKEEKPIVVVVPSYNNFKYCEKNLHSIFEQDYSNYRVIYVDDCSNDGMYEKVKETIAQHKQESRVTLIRNEKRCFPLPNTYNAIHSCRDDEIVAILDGDDWFAHERVLSEVNKYYANPDVWVTYGKAISHPEYRETHGKAISSRILKERKSRETKKFYLCMLRTFYAGLFKKIRFEDFLYKGKFLTMSGDMATMYPLAEMASNHLYLADQILYIINRSNPINDSKVDAELQLKLDQFIREMPKYPTLSALPCRQTEWTTDVLLFSKDNPLYLGGCLESIQKHFKGLGHFTVICSASSPEFKKGYEELASVFETVSFIASDQLSSYLKEKKCSSDYLLIGEDKFLFKEDVDLKKHLAVLDKTGAKAFLFNTDRTSLDASPLFLENKTVAFQILKESKNRELYQGFAMGIFKSDAFPLNDFAKNAPFFHETFSEWSESSFPNGVVLTMDHLPLVKLPDLACLASLREKLLNDFLCGQKIDLSKIESMRTNSEIPLVKR